MLFAVYGLALWLAGSGIGARGARFAMAGWTVVALAFFVVRAPSYLDESRVAQTFDSVAPCMARGATMAQVNLAYYHPGSLSRTDPFTAEAGRIAAETQGHDLGSFEGLFPYFLFANRPDNDPFTYLATLTHGWEDFQHAPPHISLEAYGRRPDGVVDYLVVFGRPMATQVVLASHEWVDLSAELDDGYRLAARTTDDLVEVYERLGSEIADTGAAMRAADTDAVCHPLASTGSDAAAWRDASPVRQGTGGGQGSVQQLTLDRSSGRR
jgi:hypothetical protein